VVPEGAEATPSTSLGGFQLSAGTVQDVLTFKETHNKKREIFSLHQDDKALELLRLLSTVAHRVWICSKEGLPEHVITQKDLFQFVHNHAHHSKACQGQSS
jgi:hypothetical protein